MFVILFPLTLRATSPEERTRLVSWECRDAEFSDIVRASDRSVVFQNKLSSIISCDYVFEGEVRNCSVKKLLVFKKVKVIFKRIQSRRGMRNI